MKLELKINEVVLLLIVILLSVAANLPDSLIGRYIDTNILLSVLAGVIIISLFRYLRWMLFLTVTVLALGANLPEQIANVVKVEPIVMVATLIVLVLVSLLNHVFKLLPTDAKAKRTDSSQSRIAVLEAVKAGNLNKLKHLFQMNVEIDFIQDGTSPAHIIAEQGNDEMIQAMIEYGVNLNVINKEGLTPMEVAMAFGFNHTVEIIKQSGKVEMKAA